MDSLFELDEPASPDAVEVYVSRLRKKLEGSRATITTLRGVGYLLRPREDDAAGSSGPAA
jgi:DNA-binding response OmpR family regulator